MTVVKMITEKTIVEETARTVYCSQNAVSPADVLATWVAVAEFVAFSLKANKAVAVPGLGTFRVATRPPGARAAPSGENLVPCFNFHVRFQGQRQQANQQAHAAEGSAFPLRYEYLKTKSSLSVQQLKRVVAELMRCVAKWMLSGRSINIEMPLVGKLQRFSADKTLRMLFYSDLVWPTLPAERNPVVQHASWAADAAPVPIKTKPQKEKVGKARKVKKPANRVPPPPAAPTPVVLDGVTLPPGLARVWEACLKEDKVKHGWVKRIVFERLLQVSSRKVLKVVGGGAVLDLIEEWSLGKAADYVHYKPLIMALVSLFNHTGGPTAPAFPPPAAPEPEPAPPPPPPEPKAAGSYTPGKTRKGGLEVARLYKESLKGSACLVEDNAALAAVPYPRSMRERLGLIGPKRSMYPPQLANAATRVDTLLGYSTDYSGQRVATVERVMPVVEPAVSKKTLDAWNREHSMRVRRVRAESGITPKPNTPAYDMRDLMSSTKWAAPRAPPPPPAAAVGSPPDASSPAAARGVSSSRAGALADLAGLASDDAPAAMAEADCCRHWVSQSHKFEGEVGLRDCELTGRVAPKPYDMGFKRSTQQAVWADRSSVDEFNRALIAARNARPATASADEKAYVPSSQETWVGVTPKVTGLGWDGWCETTYNARRPQRCA